MSDAETTRLAEAFRARHRSPPPLLLPNAWNGMSARVFAAAGFEWFATTSADVVWSLGYLDGEIAPWQDVVAATARIVRAARRPVTADIEAGYAETLDALGARTTEILRTGIVGLNIEDGTRRPEAPIRDLDAQCARVCAVWRAAEAAGVALVINARVDLFLLRLGDERTRFDESVRRAKAYLAAGADCVYPIAFADPEVIGRFVAAVGAPVNVTAHAGTPNLAALGRLGVTRVSIATSAALAALALTREIVASLRQSGGFDSLAAGMTHPETKLLFGSPAAGAAATQA